MTEKTENKVAITLTGAGIIFKSEISPITAASVLRLCLATGQENLGSVAPAILTSESPLGDERISLGEFVQKHESTTYPEKILTIAVYLKELKGRETFSPEDIRPLFRTIGDIPPANFGRDFRVTLGNSWIAPDDRNSNIFYVTSIGLAALKSNFTSDSTKKRKTRKRRKNGATVGKKKGEKAEG